VVIYLYDFDTKEVLKRIEIEIHRKKMSKKEFYEKSGVSSASYSQWNTGKHKPTLKNLVQIASVLDVTVEYLTGETNKKSPALDEGETIQPRNNIHAMIDALTDEEFEKLQPALNKMLSKE
jgi:transcriptional regulator with XRE-family HTH domain